MELGFIFSFQHAIIALEITNNWFISNTEAYKLLMGTIKEPKMHNY